MAGQVFRVTPVEHYSMLKWMAEQDANLLAAGESVYTGASGGRFTYCFTPTSIGTTLTVCDNLSGEEKDFTDYDSW